VTQDDVLRRLLSLAAARFGKDAAALSGPDDFYQALDIDSMEALSLLTALETELSVEVPDYEVQDCRTFDELAAVIARRLG
jgi:acyl carrier protein